MSNNQHLNEFDRFGQITSSILHLYQTWARQQGINYNTLAVLHTLVRFGSTTQQNISALWELPKQTVSKTCQHLYAQGLIEYMPSLDKREKMLILTQAGKDHATPIIARLDHVEGCAIKAFGEQKAQAFLADLVCFGQMLAKAMQDDGVPKSS